VKQFKNIIMEKEIKEIIKATSMDKFERKLVIKLLLNLLIKKL